MRLKPGVENRSGLSTGFAAVQYFGAGAARLPERLVNLWTERRSERFFRLWCDDLTGLER